MDYTGGQYCGVVRNTRSGSRMPGPGSQLHRVPSYTFRKLPCLGFLFVEGGWG